MSSLHTSHFERYSYSSENKLINSLILLVLWKMLKAWAARVRDNISHVSNPLHTSDNTLHGNKQSFFHYLA
jgi:hypothetical protein